ncbi:MAG TPA: superoxide dismutase family protein [Flavobacteriaceae bacterium]|nr:superoxide dismutase family protein [Flavobacteriaceae bacterium]
MKKLGLFLTATALFAFIACNNTPKDKITEESDVEDFDPAPDLTKDEPERVVQVVLDPKSGSNVHGDVYFTEKDGKVHMEAKVSGLTPNKKHAIHLHENGDCSADDGASAGGHWNPTGKVHGKWDHNDGYHKGDIGNIEANADGEVALTFETDQWCIGCGETERDIVGKSIIIHADEDDFKTQPTGNAGGRIACGVIR